MKWIQVLVYASLTSIVRGEHHQPGGPNPATATGSGDAPAAVTASLLATPLDEYKEVTIAGFRVLVDPEAEATGRDWRRVRAALLFDLEQVALLLPEPALERIRATPIAVTLATPSRPGWEGGSAACLHVSEGWLVSHGYDTARAGVVEILHMDRYLLWRAEQPMMLLHELAHAYHLGLEEGYEDARVVGAFESASASGRYEAVEHVLGGPGQERRAYALSNPQEYFAELTEAYFGRNDFYPFTRADLAAHDAAGYAMIESVWGIEPPDPAGQ